MKICYTLSNGQRKELMVRGRPVMIALPAPPIEVDDPIDWAKSMLPADLRQCVVSAELREVRVDPTGSRENPPTVLPHIMGSIVTDDHRGWTVCHVAVVVRLEHSRPTRGTATKLQWPAGVTVDGRPLI